MHLWQPECMQRSSFCNVEYVVFADCRLPIASCSVQCTLHKPLHCVHCADCRLQSMLSMLYLQIAPWDSFKESPCQLQCAKLHKPLHIADCTLGVPSWDSLPVALCSAQCAQLHKPLHIALCADCILQSMLSMFCMSSMLYLQIAPSPPCRLLCIGHLSPVLTIAHCTLCSLHKSHCIAVSCACAKLFSPPQIKTIFDVRLSAHEMFSETTLDG